MLQSPSKDIDLSGRDKSLKWNMDVDSKSSIDAEYKLSLSSYCNFRTSHQINRSASVLRFPLKHASAAKFLMFRFER